MWCLLGLSPEAAVRKSAGACRGLEDALPRRLTHSSSPLLRAAHDLASPSPTVCSPKERARPQYPLGPGLRSDIPSLFPYSIAHTVDPVQGGRDCSRAWIPGGRGHWVPS